MEGIFLCIPRESQSSKEAALIWNRRNRAEWFKERPLYNWGSYMRGKIGSRRGRPRGKHSRFDSKVLEYLVRISAKFEIHRTRLLNAIVDAWKNGKANCQELIIELRIKKKGRGIFLITKSDTVVAQFPISKHILEDTDPFSGFEHVG